MDASIIFGLLIWVVCSALLILDSRSNKGQVFTLVYFGLTALNFVPPVMIRLFPGIEWESSDLVYDGFYLATLGAGAFAVGVFLLKRFLPDFEVRAVSASEKIEHTALVRKFAIFGLVAFAIYPLVGDISSVGPVIGAASAVLWFCVWWYSRRTSRGIFGLSGKWILAIFVVLAPIYTIATSAFLGFGAVISVIFAFLLFREQASIGPTKWLGLAVLTYLGLSVFVTYLRDRTELRDLIWIDQAKYSDRIAQLQTTFGKFELFDPTDNEHRRAIDGRLNQAAQLGYAVTYLNSGAAPFLKGESLYTAMIGPIPRVIWRNKPAIAGSGDLVSRTTGITFNDETSIGITHVMEFYVNFAVPGLVIGMFFMGLGLRYLDYRLARAEAQALPVHLACLFVLASATPIPGGSLSELTGSLASAFIATILIRMIAVQEKAT